MADRQRLAAHDARHGEPFDRADGDEGEIEIPVENHHQDDDKENVRQGIEHVDEAHHQPVRAPPRETGDGAVAHADQQADDGRGDADRQRYARAVEHANEQIAPHRVGAEPVRAARAAGDCVARPPIGRAGDHGIIDRIIGVRRKQRRERRGERNQGQDDNARDRGLVGEQPAACVDPQAAAFDIEGAIERRIVECDRHRA